MTTDTFQTFSLNLSVSSGDYIVGYNADGNEEYRMTLSELIEYLKPYFIYIPQTP